MLRVTNLGKFEQLRLSQNWMEKQAGLKSHFERQNFGSNGQKMHKSRYQMLDLCIMLESF